MRTLPFQVVGFRLNERLMAGWLLVAFCAVGCTAARAGSLPEFDARVWQSEEGLPHNIVQTITQTRDGFLWVGTHEGVARFDRVSFTPLELTPGAPQPSVTSLCESQDGSLWFGTEKSGLYRLRNGTLSHYGRAEGLESEAVTQVRETRDGTLWIGLQDGVALWRDGRIQFPASSVLTTNTVLSLCVTPDGSLWVGASRGLQAWRDQKVANYREADGVPLRAIRGLCSDADGGLWIGRNGGLSLMKAGAFTHYGKGSGPAGIVTSVLRDGLGNLWVGSFGGLSRFVDGKFINEPREDGAAYAVHALFEDREGTVWVGFEDGLARLLPKRFVTYTRQQGLARNAIASVCAGPDGGIWIGTWGGGLTELINGQTNAFGRTNGLSSNFVVALNAARDGSLWVGTEYPLRCRTKIMPITICIVEDDAELRQSIGSFIQGAEGFKCKGGYGSGEEALAAIPGRNPQVVLMDINLPGMNGIECVRRLKDRARRPRHRSNILRPASNKCWTCSPKAARTSKSPRKWTCTSERCAPTSGAFTTSCTSIAAPTRW